MPGIDIWTCPPIRSVVAWPLPRYGMWFIFMPVIDASSAAKRCWPLPLPDDA
jgi:hypothetical protein